MCGHGHEGRFVKLAQRDLPAVNFRRDLPAYLAGGEPCHIGIDGRAAGAINPAYMAGMEALTLKARAIDRKADRITDDDEFVRARSEGAKVVARDRLGVLYDACVISWQTNILDDGKPAACTRENFLALAEAKVPEIAKAILDFERECLQAGADILAEAGQTEKN